jgi:hypothetical protein
MGMGMNPGVLWTALKMYRGAFLIVGVLGAFVLFFALRDGTSGVITFGLVVVAVLALPVLMLFVRDLFKIRRLLRQGRTIPARVVGMVEKQLGSGRRNTVTDVTVQLIDDLLPGQKQIVVTFLCPANRLEFTMSSEIQAIASDDSRDVTVGLGKTWANGYRDVR